MTVEPAGRKPGLPAPWQDRRLLTIVLLSLCLGVLIAWGAGGLLSSHRPAALPAPAAALP
ncbi:hypothetical protein HUK83_16605, partial [Endobacter medicaginis]|nr:hypothetical protein [Endobacter medicaginis]